MPWEPASRPLRCNDEEAPDYLLDLDHATVTCSVTHVVTGQLDSFRRASCLLIWRGEPGSGYCGFMTEDADHVRNVNAPSHR